MTDSTDARRTQSKGPIVVRNTILTPSASPPLPGAAPLTARLKSTSRPPPPKRARVYSSSSSPQPSNRASSSSSRASFVDPTRDEAWRASSKRLLDVWSSLAERYNVPLDQDDIIDLRTVELIKDRGVVRGTKATFEIGYFGAPNVDEGEGDRSQEGEEAEEVEEEEEDDELDAFAPEPSVPVKIEMEKVKRHVPPFRAGDPDDASDLREFLEEERRRREMEEETADEGEGTDIIDLLDLTSSDEDEPLRSRPSSADRALSTPQVVVQARSTPEHTRRSRPPLAVRKVVAECALTAPDGESEDEFAAWDADEPTPVAAVPRTSRSSRKNVQVEIPSPVSSPTARAKAKRIARVQPVVRSVSPQPFPPASSDVPSSPPARVASPLSTRTRSVTRNLQLQTPPTSHTASSVTDGTPDMRSSLAPRPSTPPPPRSPKSARVDSSSPPPRVSSPSSSSLPVPISSSTRRATAPLARRQIVEVLVPTRSSIISSRQKTKQKSDVPARSGHNVKTAPPPPVAPRPAKSPQLQSSKEKGKGRASKSMLMFEDLSDDEPLPPPPRMRRSHTQPPMSSPGSDSLHRKRKRSPPTLSANRTSPDQALKSPQPVNVKNPNTKSKRSPSEPTRSRKITEGKGKGKASHISDEESGVLCRRCVVTASPHCHPRMQILVLEVVQAGRIDADPRPSRDLPPAWAVSTRCRYSHILHICYPCYPPTTIGCQISVIMRTLLSRQCRTHRRSFISHMP